MIHNQISYRFKSKLHLIFLFWLI